MTEALPALDPAGLPPEVDAIGRRFEWLALLGQGGFGDVFLARMTSPGGLVQSVAVKLLQRGLDPRSQAVERLRDEARTLAALRHPVLLTAHDLAVLGDRVAMVTEYVDGQDLSAVLEGGPMPAGPLLEVVAGVASALAACWGQLSVVHRDVKPANIRIGRHGNVKLLDLGIARSALEGRAARTGSAMLVGTPGYFAPERFARREPPGPASDVFSLGCVLYEGLVGESLFGGFDLPGISGLATRPSQWSELVDEHVGSDRVRADVRSLLRSMLAHRAADRPTADAVALRCEDLVAHDPSGLRLTRWCRDRRWPASPLSEPASPSTRWQRSPAVGEALLTGAPSLAAPLAPATPRSPRSSAGLRWAGVAAATTVTGAAVSGAVAVVGVLLVAAGIGWWSRPDPAPPPATVATARVAAPIAAPPPLPTPAEPAPAPATAPARTQTAPARPNPPPAPPEAATEPVPVARASPPPPTHDIVFSSIPAGAEVFLVATGERLGTTPLVRGLPAGDLAVRLVAPSGARVERTLRIGRDAPGRYVWDVARGSFEGRY